MIRHIVCFRLKEPTDENCRAAQQMLLSMRERIPLLQSLHVGINVCKSARAYDLVLEAELQNPEALEAYDRDAYHCEVVKAYMHDRVDGCVSVDYEF